MRKLFGLVLILALCLIFPSNAFAISPERPDDKVSPTSGTHKDDDTVTFEEIDVSITENAFLKEFGVLSVESIRFDNTEYDLYPVFSNADYALEKFNSICSDTLTKLSVKYSLPSFGAGTWTEYYEYAKLELLQAPSTAIGQVVDFLDVYSGYGLNDEIRAFIEPASAERIALDEAKAQLSFMLPYTNPLLSKLQASVQSSRAWNTTNATNYATTWAEVSQGNPAYIFISGGDCANFASQIRYNGGMPMTSTWYYYSSSNRSDKWCYADDFARMMSWAITPTHDLRTFSRGILTGKFISVDFTGNGTYDHCGYITDADDYVADWLVVASNGTNYGTVNYWDFKVAQHTSNYNRWASAKDLMNGWDVLYFTNPSCKYVVCNP